VSFVWILIFLGEPIPTLSMCGLVKFSSKLFHSAVVVWPFVHCLFVDWVDGSHHGCFSDICKIQQHEHV
jgi:hypothetical protein